MIELAFHALELLGHTMDPPANRGKAAARGTSFNDKHKLEYDLKVVGKDTKTDKINLIACICCVAYGVEEKSELNG